MDENETILRVGKILMEANEGECLAAKDRCKRRSAISWSRRSSQSLQGASANIWHKVKQ